MQDIVNSEPTKYGLAKYLEQYDLTVNSLVRESGRSRDTLYTWFKNDRQLLDCIVRSCLVSSITREAIVFLKSVPKVN